jgi:hypothetical protein
MTRRVTSLWVPAIALVAVVASGAWLVTQEGFGPGDWDGNGSMMDHGSMMGGSSGSGPVEGLADARDRVEEFAEAVGGDLRVGAVMRFTKNYYAELEEPDGTKSTEVLVDPRNGAVQLEFGPAMMWNTRYGMMGGSSSETLLTARDAREAAEEWVADHDGLAVGRPEAFPGYYTLHTVRDGQIDGMLSVNATDGDVWYHSWHGDFLAMTEGD